MSRCISSRSSLVPGLPPSRISILVHVATLAVAGCFLWPFASAQSAGVTKRRGHRSLKEAL
jgi:hypothetical protein